MARRDGSLERQWHVTVTDNHGRVSHWPLAAKGPREAADKARYYFANQHKRGTYPVTVQVKEKPDIGG